MIIRPKEEGQTIQWLKEERQTIQWPKEKGQTIQWLKEEGQTIQWPKEEGQTTFSEHTNSWVLCGLHDNQSLVFCVVFCQHLFVILSFFF
jgi:hypothetical protein